MIKLLIVEDDRRLQLTLKQLLNSHHRRIFVTDEIERSIALLEKHKFQLAIIDRRLKDGDGLDLVKYCHKTSFETKIIVLTQLGLSLEKIKGLESGADDYLTKPFTHKELELRVRRLLEKSKLVKKDRILKGDVELHLDSGYLLVGGQVIGLRKKELEIFKILLANANQVISKETLLDRVWSNYRQRPTQNTVEVYIRRIRKKLGDHGHRIKTLRNFGYYWLDRGK